MLRIGQTPQVPVEEPIAPVEEMQEMPPEDPTIPMQMGLISPESARYFGPESRCQGCIHFSEPSQCEVVSGPIDPAGVCMLFQADEMDEMPLEESEAAMPDLPTQSIPPGMGA